MTQPKLLCALTLTVALGACDAGPPATTPTRETLPNGAVLIRYPALPAIDHVGPDVTEAHVDLQLGTRGGDDPNFIFGDIRGVQAASDGTIFVLDYQAIEVRVFSPDGEFLRTIVRQGEGPGEVREANGIVLAGDTLLWVNDHGQWAVVGVDDDDDEEVVDEETGPYEESFRSYFKSYDLSTEEVDSVYLGESIWRGYASVTELGSSYYGLPFAVSNVAVVNPSGGFWSTNTGSYSLARRGEGGDTLMVIEATLPRVPVTSEDRSSYVQGIVERQPEELRAAELWPPSCRTSNRSWTTYSWTTKAGSG